MKRSVVIVQRILPHYRFPFFDRMDRALCDSSIRMQVIYGQEYPGSVPKSIPVDRPWACCASNRYVKLGGREIVFQQAPSEKLSADLVILEQANRLLSNYPILFSREHGRRIAYWGHGKNMQNGRGFSEKLKRKLLKKVDWWFAYTDVSREIVCGAGFPDDRITVVQNAIDTHPLVNGLDGLSKKAALEILRRENISGDHVGLFCGSLYADKSLDFLLRASKRIHEKLGSFELVVVGSGPESEKIEAAARRYSWIHYPGPKFGDDLFPYLRCARAMLIPGAVGLVVMESFAAELPLITVSNNRHGPEIAYIENGINGIVTKPSEEAYAEAAVKLFTAERYRERLKEGCRISARKYTLDKMVANMTQGILACLEA